MEIYFLSFASRDEKLDNYIALKYGSRCWGKSYLLRQHCLEQWECVKWWQFLLHLFLWGM